MRAAAAARDYDHADDLTELGGAFAFPAAARHYLAGSVLLDIPGDGADARTELEHAIKLWAEPPEPGEDHGRPCHMTARAGLATAALRAGDLDAAGEAAGPVLALPPGQRISALPCRLQHVRNELAAPCYQRIPQAGQLDQQIEEFCRDTLVTRLHDQPARR